MESKLEITMLGTGSAFPSHSYNCCMAMRYGTELMIVDGGGGNGVFARLAHAGIAVGDIHRMFVTHSHTDHIFGAVWIIRRAVGLSFDGKYDGRLTVYGNSEVVDAIRGICGFTFLKSYLKRMEEIVELRRVDTGDCIDFGGARMRFVDCGSENVAQTGFRIDMPSGTTVVCLGDEALTEGDAVAAVGADWLFCGAFCRYADRDIFRPYEKHHFTVRDVARCAAVARVKNLVLYHCEDSSGPARENLYRAEAAEVYGGNVYVPSDGDTFVIV